MELPGYWLVISTCFFALGSISFLATAFLAFGVLRMLRDIKPKLDAMALQAESIAKKVDGIATKVDQMADSAKSTVDVVGGSTKSLATTLASGLVGGSRRMQSVGSIGMWVVTAIRLYQQFSALRANAKARASRQTSSEGLDKEATRKQ